jgi:hypothetical protein
MHMAARRLLLPARRLLLSFIISSTPRAVSIISIVRAALALASAKKQYIGPFVDCLFC